MHNNFYARIQAFRYELATEMNNIEHDYDITGVQVLDNVHANLQNFRKIEYVFVKKGDDHLIVSAKQMTTLHFEIWLKDQRIHFGIYQPTVDLARIVDPEYALLTSGLWTLQEPREGSPALFTVSNLNRYMSRDTNDNVIYRPTISDTLTRMILYLTSACHVATEFQNAA